MTSALKPSRKGRPPNKKLKKKNHSVGIQRLQKVLGSVSAEHEAEINLSTSTPAGLDESDISPPQDTILRASIDRSGHASTILKDGWIPVSSAPRETSGPTSPRAQSSSLAPEGFNNDMTNGRGFSRLSETEHQTVEAIAACKAATSILIEIVNKDSNNGYITPYSGGGLRKHGFPHSSPIIYASPYSNSVPNVNVTPLPSPSTNDAGKRSIDPGRQPLDRTKVNVDVSTKKRKPQELPLQPCDFAEGDLQAKRRKRNSSVQYLSPNNGFHKRISTNDSTRSRKRFTEGSKQTWDEGIDELKGSTEENEKVYTTTLAGIDSFLTQAKGRFPGPDSDDSDNDPNHVNGKCAEEQSHNGESTISPPSSPQPVNGKTMSNLQNPLLPGDRDIFAIVDRIVTDILPSESSHSLLPQGIPHLNFRGSLEAHRLATELKRQITVLNPQNNVIVSKDLGLAMSTFYNHLSSRAFSCSKMVIPLPQAQSPLGMATPMAQPGLLPMNYQPLPAHVYQHVPPPATFNQTVLPSQPASFIAHGAAIPPSTIPLKGKLKIRTYGFPPAPGTSSEPKRKQRS